MLWKRAFYCTGIEAGASVLPVPSDSGLDGAGEAAGGVVREASGAGGGGKYSGPLKPQPLKARSTVTLIAARRINGAVTVLRGVCMDIPI